MCGSVNAGAMALATIVVGFLGLGSGSLAADSFPTRMANVQRTGNVGEDPKLTPENVRDLEVVAYFETGAAPLEGEACGLACPTTTTINATPVVGDDLIFIGDWGGRFYVFDAKSGKVLVILDTGTEISFWNQSFFAPYDIGIQSTAVLAEVTVPDEAGGTREEKRVYIGSDRTTESFWCLDVDRILAERETLDRADGSAYICSGPTRDVTPAEAPPPLLTTVDDLDTAPSFERPLWPLSLEGAAPGAPYSPNFHGTPLFRKDQTILVNGNLETRDVLFVPSVGADCANGVLWAMDAYTGEKLWQWDPVVAGDSMGGVIWTAPAISRDGNHLYVTTGDCINRPQVGELAEATVSLDPVTGDLQWFRQARLVDVTDLDIGSSPTVVDVEGQDGCRRVVNPDKDGCIYAFEQDPDIPEVGEAGYDVLRPGQQRLLWRQCLVDGGPDGGFNATGASLHGRWIFAEARGGRGNARGFALDACTGELERAYSEVRSGYSDGVIASGMWFIPSASESRLQVIRATPPFDVLATVFLPDVATGGGGPAIVDGTIYVPTRTGGVALVRVVEGSEASVPVPGPVLDYPGPTTGPTGLRAPAEEVEDTLKPYGSLLF